MAGLKRVYGAPTLDDAEFRLEEFREKWNGKYPQILKSWDANWAELTTYFKYPEEVRREVVPAVVEFEVAHQSEIW